MRPLPLRPARAAALSAALVFAAAGVQARQPAPLEALVRQQIAPVAERAFVGVQIASLTRGDSLCSINADLPFTPASNAKLATSVTALETLGPDFSFTTNVLATGVLEDGGRLRGSLILLGGGDPVLAEPDLALLARGVREAGIRRVSGDLIADPTRFDDRRLGSSWEWDDEPFYYAAQISALTVDRNVCRVTVRPGSEPGRRPEVLLTPLPGYMEVDNRARTAARGEAGALEITRARGRNVVVVTGSIALGAPDNRDVPVTVEDPTRFCAQLFRRALSEAGVVVDGRVETRVAPGGSWPVAEHRSPPLSRIISDLNKPSDNLIAEILLKSIGWRAAGQGTAEEGVKQVRALLSQAGADVSRVVPQDGSGLSRHNLTTPRAIVALLTFAHGRPWHSAFRASLPVAGVDGTLRLRMTDGPAKGKVFAKTGSLAQVSALSGYAVAANGEEIVFSILTNNFPGSTSRTGPVKRMEDGVAGLLTEFRR